MQDTQEIPIADEIPQGPPPPPYGPPAESPPAEKSKAPPIESAKKKKGRKPKIKTEAERAVIAERRRERDRTRKRKKAAARRAEAPPVGPSPRFRAPPPPPPSDAPPPMDEPTIEPESEEFAGVNMGAMLDPAMLASVGVAMLDAGAVMLSMRVLGEDAAALSAMGTPKQELLENAAAAYLATLDVAMSPAQVLLATVFAVYVPPALMMYGQQKMGAT